MRVVSLVPSLTETIAWSAPGVLVGATTWCVRPAGLDVPRCGGTKNPDIEAILRLVPDLVVVNDEENRLADVERLRAAGVSVHVTSMRTVGGALEELAALLVALDAPERGWLDEARAAWADPEPVAGHRMRALVPVWRRPWMAVGSQTYAGDLLARLGVDNVLSTHPQRYPRIDLADVPAVDVVVLPDEPYPFGALDGPEEFPALPVAFVDGQALTWYGPRMISAPAHLRSAIRRGLRR